jgi:hypothetical protein
MAGRTLIGSPEARSGRRYGLPGAIRGVFAGFSENGEALVDFLRNPARTPVPAASTIDLSERDAGREALLVFEDGAAARPIIIGLIAAQRNRSAPPIEVSADGKRVTITADQEISLFCGASSITLTRAGKVLIRGAYLLSRSSGLNRIKGGSVQIN